MTGDSLSSSEEDSSPEADLPTPHPIPLPTTSDPSSGEEFLVLQNKGDKHSESFFHNFKTSRLPENFVQKYPASESSPKDLDHEAGTSIFIDVNPEPLNWNESEGSVSDSDF